MTGLLVKVCGLTSAADAALSFEAGADLLGFVVHPPSPRHCPDPATAAGEVLDRAVLVMVSADPDLLARTAEAAGIRRIQPHTPPAERIRVAGALRARGFDLILPWPDAPDQDPVAGALWLWEPGPAVTGLEGGSGQANPLGHPPPGPFLLAGGLDGAVLPDRVRALPPGPRAGLRGFDAASRLESAPGRKDPDKVRAYVRAARTLDLGGPDAL